MLIEQVGRYMKLNHKSASFIKSALRIAGYIFMLGANQSIIVWAGIFLLIAELFGIAEELVDYE